VLEIAGLGPVPFCGMMLSDLGSDVIRIDRVDQVGISPRFAPPADVVSRGRRSIAVDLKRAEGRNLVLDLVTRSDVFLEGFRPGVCERLGIGPDACLGRNPRLVYGRMTGWGQSGPKARLAGHDINYIALTGALYSIGRAGSSPVPPLNLVGDYGGGAMYLAFGVAAALFEASRSGVGQVVDAAMTDGSASLMNFIWGMKDSGEWIDTRGTNIIDSGAHFYDVYECSDGGYIAVGAIEPAFYAQLIEVLGLGGTLDVATQLDQETWPASREILAKTFVKKSRDEWSAILEDLDACVTPVLSPEEAVVHPHNVARATFTVRDGVSQASPAPRFDHTPGSIQGTAPKVGQHTDEVLTELGLAHKIQALRDEGLVA
jgi:alpha-methylacyl-CoA racemase